MEVEHAYDGCYVVGQDNILDPFPSFYDGVHALQHCDIHEVTFNDEHHIFQYGIYRGTSNNDVSEHECIRVFNFHSFIRDE